MKAPIQRVISALLLAAFSAHASEDSEALKQYNAERKKDATKHFQDYLFDCATNEIRCIYFPDFPWHGEIMTLNLRTYTALTAREIYDWATQAQHTHELTHPQILSLKEICSELLKSDRQARFGQGISVSYRRDDGALHVLHFNLDHPPTAVRRLYDIGGGFLPNGGTKTPGTTISRGFGRHETTANLCDWC